MSEQELKRRLIALEIMEAVLHVHDYYFPRHEKWSPECRHAIEGLRIFNKCQALIAHDRTLLSS